MLFFCVAGIEEHLHCSRFTWTSLTTRTWAVQYATTLGCHYTISWWGFSSPAMVFWGCCGWCNSLLFAVLYSTGLSGLWEVSWPHECLPPSCLFTGSHAKFLVIIFFSRAITVILNFDSRPHAGFWTSSPSVSVWNTLSLSFSMHPAPSPVWFPVTLLTV